MSERGAENVFLRLRWPQTRWQAGLSQLRLPDLLPIVTVRPISRAGAPARRVAPIFLVTSGHPCSLGTSCRSRVT